MARSLITLLLGLSTCVSSALTVVMSPTASQISGNWTNELGSTMTLTAYQNGSITGTGLYTSAVGDAEDLYDLTGQFDTLPSLGKGVAVGWVVAWKNKEHDLHSIATWSGQYFDNNGVETILTQWLLTTSSAQNDVWDSTLVGHDEYTRV